MNWRSLSEGSGSRGILWFLLRAFAAWDFVFVGLGGGERDQERAVWAG